MADLLSLYRVIGDSSGQNNCLINQQIHTTSFAVWVAATYSASVVDNVTSSCFFDDHDTALPLMRNTYPKIAHLCSCNAPSALTYPTSPLFSPPYTNSNFCVPCRCYGSVTFVSFTISLTFHFPLLFHHAPCLLLTSFIYFIRDCAPHAIIMFNHDDSMPLPTLTLYKYSRCSRL